MDEDLGAERKSLVLSLCHKSFCSAAQTVLVSLLFPLDTMAINYIKAGLVNLAGASCWRKTLWYNEDHSSLPWVFGPALRHSSLPFFPPTSL